MAIGTITVGAEHGQVPDAPTFVKKLSFPGDGAYAAGGTANFQDSVRAAVGVDIELITIVADDCGGYIPVYDKAADKLKVYEQTDTATTPLIETVTANLSGTTFNITVIGR